MALSLPAIHARFNEVIQTVQEVPYSFMAPPLDCEDTELFAGVPEVPLPAGVPINLNGQHPAYLQRLNMRVIDDSLQLHKNRLADQVRLYWKYLTTACAGQDVDVPPAELASAEQGIQDYYQAIAYIVGAAKENLKVRTIVSRHFSIEVLRPHNILQQYHNIIELQAALNKRPPFRLIADLAFGCLVDIVQVEKFAKEINHNKIKVAVLRNGLHAIVNHLAVYHTSRYGNSAPSYAKVIVALLKVKVVLANRGLSMPHSFVNGSDDKYLEIRRNKTPGAWIKFTSYRQDRTGRTVQQVHEVVVGRSLGAKADDTQDHYVYFEVVRHCLTERVTKPGEEDFEECLEMTHTGQEQADCKVKALLIAYNNALIDQILAYQERHVGLRLAQIFHVARNGKCALVERLSPLCDADWKTKKYEPANKKVVAEYLRHLATHHFLPKPLLARHLMYNREGRLRNAHITMMSDFDLQELERFVLSVAENDLTLFKEYMTLSGLSEHIHAKILRRAVHVACTESEFNRTLFDNCEMNISEFPNIGQERELLLNQSEELYHHTLAFWKECCEFIAFRKGGELTQDQKEKIRNLIEAKFLAIGVATHFVPPLKEEVAQAFLGQKL